MYKKILVGIDPSAEDRSHHALEIATHLAEDETALITAVTVLESLPAYLAAHITPEDEARVAEAAMTHLRDVAGRYSDIKTEIQHGKPAEALLHYAETHGIDCIVIASHKPGLGDYFLGSTAARIVRHAACSVHVIR